MEKWQREFHELEKVRFKPVGREEIHQHKRQEVTMKSSIRDKAEGTLHQVKGKIKEVAGKVTDNPELEAKGKAEKLAGKAQEKVGEAKKVLGE